MALKHWMDNILRNIDTSLREKSTDEFVTKILREHETTRKRRRGEIPSGPIIHRVDLREVFPVGGDNSASHPLTTVSGDLTPKQTTVVGEEG